MRRAVAFNTSLNGTVVLEEVLDPSYVPAQAEVLEYARWLGMDPDNEEDQQLLWISKEGIRAPLAENWKPCRNLESGDLYYFNFTTGESSWLHPNDVFYRKLYADEKLRRLESKSRAATGVKMKHLSSSSGGGGSSGHGSSDGVGGVIGNGDGASLLQKKGLPPTSATGRSSGRLVLDPMSLTTVFSKALAPSSISSSKSSSATIEPDVPDMSKLGLFTDKSDSSGDTSIGSSNSINYVNNSSNSSSDISSNSKNGDIHIAPITPSAPPSSLSPPITAFSPKKRIAQVRVAVPTSDNIPSSAASSLNACQSKHSSSNPNPSHVLLRPNTPPK